MRMPGEEEIPRQAVIVADSFNSRFKPITLDRPRCLLPLANKPLLDYTISHLVDNGFWDLILLSCAHSDQIDQHLSDTYASDTRLTIRNIILNSDNVASLGDAMRELSVDGVIRGPFVLVTGDLVSNMDMRSAMEAHQRYKKRDKEAIMTCILKRVLPGHPTRGLEDDLVICVDPETNQLLRYQNANSKRFEYELDLFNRHEVVDFRYDLMNTYVIICEAHVPSRFGDHFDIQEMESFIKNIIGDEELSSETIYMHTLDHSYAARVCNLWTYHSVTQDIMGRWVYPVVPDRPSHEQYIYRGDGVYLSHSAKNYKAQIEKNVIVGPESTLGRESRVSDSVIGSRCEIKSDVHITNSHVWDEVTIESGCRIDGAVLCSGVTVKEGTTITPDCILSYDTTVGPNITLKPGTRIMAPLRSIHRTESECSNDSEDTRCSDDLEVTEAPSLGVDHWGVLYDSEGERHSYRAAALRDGELLSDSSDSTPVPSEHDDEEAGFYSEVLDSFRAGFAIRKDVESVLIEVNASKHAYNISVWDQLLYATRALLEMCPVPAQFRAHATYFAPLFCKLVRGDRACETVILGEAAAWARETGRLGELQNVLHALYDLEVLEEGSILEWAGRLERGGEVRERIERFVQWLEEAEEESSEEEEED